MMLNLSTDDIYQWDWQPSRSGSFSVKTMSMEVDETWMKETVVEDVWQKGSK